jgi:hypothetical protein
MSRESRLRRYLDRSNDRYRMTRGGRNSENESDEHRMMRNDPRRTAANVYARLFALANKRQSSRVALRGEPNDGVN